MDALLGEGDMMLSAKFFTRRSSEVLRRKILWHFLFDLFGCLG